MTAQIKIIEDNISELFSYSFSFFYFAVFWFFGLLLFFFFCLVSYYFTEQHLRFSQVSCLASPGNEMINRLKFSVILIFCVNSLIAPSFEGFVFACCVV